MSTQPLPIDVCPQHNAPMVVVKGRKVCIAEYFNNCITTQKVVDVLLEGRTIWYVFQDGHAVPLLCSCCGKPLGVKDIDAERKDVVGRRLVSTAASLVELDGGQQIIEFLLEFSRKRLFGKGLTVPVSLDVAARMRHPESCLLYQTFKRSTPKKTGQKRGQTR